MFKYILDVNNRPVRCDDVMEWGRWYQNADRHVGVERRGDVKVSTVFLGLDHAFTPGKPVLWKTMIFGGEHDGWQDRYTSLEDAQRGHLKAVELAFAADAVDPSVASTGNPSTRDK